MEHAMSNNVPATNTTTSTDSQLNYSQILQESITGHASKINKAVDIRAQYIVENLFEYIVATVDKAFVLPEVADVTLTFNLDPACKMSTVEVEVIVPSTPNQTAWSTIVFEEYDGEYKEYANGEFFYRKLSIVLAERLSKELCFCKKKDNNFKYELRLELSTLINQV